MVKSPDAFRTIREVAEWLDTPAHVLRFWESRFTQVKPVKRAGGRRYYRPSDMELLGGIKQLLHEDGLTIRGVQKLLREQGVRHVAAKSPALDLETGPAPREDRDAPDIVHRSPARAESDQADRSADREARNGTSHGPADTGHVSPAAAGAFPGASDGVMPTRICSADDRDGAGTTADGGEEVPERMRDAGPVEPSPPRAEEAMPCPGSDADAGAGSPPQDMSPHPARAETDHGDGTGTAPPPPPARPVLAELWDRNRSGAPAGTGAALARARALLRSMDARE